MASNPTIQAVRDVSDYLFAVDPSGQYMWGYAWDHCGGRPDDIYDVHGSGQCTAGGAFKLHGKEFVETARVPVLRNPIHLAGPGYDIFGGSFGLIPSSGHKVFRDNTPIVDFNSGNTSDYRSAPIDLRYNPFRNIYTMPYYAFPVSVNDVAPSGKAWDYNGVFINTPWNYYSVASGTYRYRVLPYAVTQDANLSSSNYPSGYMNNVMERNGDANFLQKDDIVVGFVNPNILASGTLLCVAQPSRWAKLG